MEVYYHDDTSLVNNIFVLNLSIKENSLDTGINGHKCFLSLILKIGNSLKYTETLLDFILYEITVFVILNKCLFVVDITGENLFIAKQTYNILFKYSFFF